ncbi:LuxR C-terminal-related transcriptional regulator [Larsenimonas salina]|uniref:LuxR C-terminal-related transcriptional regulator n=1 Tax=Larsenimonas salina TaxID=1295565 RepID=UPI002073CAB1|nr:LuxR C-terminal-related transcriptional regulator [Larsenimonas salina]MCM5704688.1 LuxR C-terminal-related transcriptional regulator [Larsenimonas salina]
MDILSSAGASDLPLRLQHSGGCVETDINVTVLLVTEINPQSELFVQYVRDKLNCDVEAMGPKDNVPEDLETHFVVLLDADHVNEKDMHQWEECTAKEDSNMTMAAFNLGDENQALTLATTFRLQGVFYRRDSLALICKGIAKLINSELWMSRTLMTRLIKFYRRQQINAYRPSCGLTHRELEILRLLGTGASNTEIANQLFVSEHTVKSHLYNIFRKLKVKNRIQAMNWVRQNLGYTSSANNG